MIKETRGKQITLALNSFTSDGNPYIEGSTETTITIVTNIPDSLLGPLMSKTRLPPSSGNIETIGAESFPSLLVNAITCVINDAIAYYKSACTQLNLVGDQLDALIRYMNDLQTHWTQAIMDGGCQHSCVNTEQWMVLETSGSFGAKGYFGDVQRIPIGKVAAVAKDAEGRYVLLVANQVGLVKDKLLLAGTALDG
jgi:hypothetical protein